MPAGGAVSRLHERNLAVDTDGGPGDRHGVAALLPGREEGTGLRAGPGVGHRGRGGRGRQQRPLGEVLGIGVAGGVPFQNADSGAERNRGVGAVDDAVLQAEGAVLDVLEIDLGEVAAAREGAVEGAPQECRADTKAVEAVTRGQSC